jgi:epsin
MTQVDLVAKLVEATSNETGLASISLLNELSSRTDNSEECKIIVKHCAKVLTLKPKLWKRIQRDLVLIDHIIKTGSQNFLDQMKDERDKLKDLYEFTYEEDGKDRGETSKNKNYIIIIFFIFYLYSKK